MKLTVSEYAKSVNCHIQTVYKRINKGVLSTVKENGITYVIVDNREVKPSVNESVSQSINEYKPLYKLIKQLQKQNEAKDKEIKRLTKELTKAQNGKSDVLEKFIFEMQRISAPAEEEIIDVPREKMKMKKHKKKKK